MKRDYRIGCSGSLGPPSPEFGMDKNPPEMPASFLQGLGLHEIVPIRENDAGRGLDCLLLPDELDPCQFQGDPKD